MCATGHHFATFIYDEHQCEKARQVGGCVFEPSQLLLHYYKMWQTILTAALAFGLLGLSSQSVNFYKGHDISSLKLLYDSNYTFTDTAQDNTTRPLEDILGDGGMNGARLRLWVNPSDGVYGLDYNIEMASWFVAKGYQIFLDFHFSDTWADPHHQLIPAAWPQDDVDALAATLRSYVTSVLQAFQDAHMSLSIVSLGNEIRQGMLWPLGEADPGIVDENARIANFTQPATLWSAARAGVSDAVAAGVSSPAVMIHIDNGWDLKLQQAWFGALLGTGKVTTVNWDVFGFSFYPFYGTDATYQNLQTSLNTIASTYGKPVQVVETDWPDLCPNIDTVEGRGLSEPDISISVAGQIQWVQGVIDVMKGVPQQLGQGVWYWEPAFLNNTSLGSNCSDAILFDVDWSDWPDSIVGYSRDSISMFLGG